MGTAAVRAPDAGGEPLIGGAAGRPTGRGGGRSTGPARRGRYRQVRHDRRRDGDGAAARRMPGTILTLGDNAYESGRPEDFATCYAPTWGRHLERTRPAPGNHDYQRATPPGTSRISANAQARPDSATTASISARGTSSAEQRDSGWLPLTARQMAGRRSGGPHRGLRAGVFSRAGVQLGASRDRHEHARLMAAARGRGRGRGPERSRPSLRAVHATRRERHAPIPSTACASSWSAPEAAVSIASTVRRRTAKCGITHVRRPQTRPDGRPLRVDVHCRRRPVIHRLGEQRVQSRARRPLIVPIHVPFLQLLTKEDHRVQMSGFPIPKLRCAAYRADWRSEPGAGEFAVWTLSWSLSLPVWRSRVDRPSERPANLRLRFLNALVPIFRISRDS